MLCMDIKLVIYYIVMLTCYIACCDMFITDICDISNFSDLKHSSPSAGKEKEHSRTYKAEAA